ncbi:hypothetical protein [Streptomyces sp. NPDC020141]|uniref:hypothetical protein n=1 Tax=Streptomyces sp. NPDC020141 TaxID=3365065 RepID=UPI0037A3962D
MSAPDGRTPGEITVHRCTVTVVRRGGWSWGPDPRRLVDQALEALPDLLADHFAEQLTADGPDREITGPVTVTLRTGPGRGARSAPPSLAVHTGTRPMTGSGTGPGAVTPGSTAAAPPAEPRTAGSFPWTPPPPVAPLDLFAELAERGELEALLALLPPETVRLCLRALHGPGAPDDSRGPADSGPSAPQDGRGPAGTTDPDGPGARTESAAPSPGRPHTAAAGPPPALRPADAPPATGPDPVHPARPPAEAAPAATDPARTPAARAAPGEPDLRARLLAAFAATADPAGPTDLADLLAVPAGAHPPDGPPAGGPGAGPGRTPGARTALGPTTGEARIRSVLPFLLTGPLARIGHLDALGPALAAVELADQAPLYAAALAYKVLGTTGRGWRRDERDREAAAAFAGLERPVPEERLTDFARLARPALPLLDAVLALSVCRGHDPADPLLITGADDRLLLVDAQGGFPVAWARRAAELLPYWRHCGRPTVLICDGPLPPGTYGELAAAGVPFLTAVRPLRGDPVARLPGPAALWGPRGVPPDRGSAAALPHHTERLAALVRALVTERRAAPLADDGGLERSVALAAALGLSTIAWTLWRDRETPDPLTALTRFADLDATVRFGPDAVRVRVPLGRRHADLLRSGLLADVPDVVWLGGRTLTFSGG